MALACPDGGVANVGFVSLEDAPSFPSPPPQPTGAAVAGHFPSPPCSRDDVVDVCGCRWPCRLSRNNVAVSARRKNRAGGGRGNGPRAVASLLADRDEANCGQRSAEGGGGRRANAHQRATRNVNNNRGRSGSSTAAESSTAAAAAGGGNATSTGTGTAVLNPELLPDILNSHLPPPPYSTLPQTTERSSRRGIVPASRTFASLGFLGGGRATNYTPEDEPKHCCGVVVTQTVSIRWFIILIAFVGLCCAVVGTVLGALKTTGREHLTVSLLMIGVGIVLITVSGIAWRLTSTDAPSCRMMLGLRSAEDPEPNRRFVPRIPPSYGRSHHPYAAMMYPEFQFRPPPPSYQASMQEYRLRLLLLDRQHTPTVTSMSPVSPPPTYRSQTSGRQPLTFSRENDYSRPPSYRSRTSSVMPRLAEGATAATESGTGDGRSSHSRDPSLSLSCLSHESLFEARAEGVLDDDNGNHHHHPQGTNAESTRKTPGDEDEHLLSSSSTSRHIGGKNGSALTVVQSVTDQLRGATQESVIVSVSGTNLPPSVSVQGEVEILAHL